ncbi:MAG: transglutaminase-like domain-containing protein [bacterium]
MRAHKLTASLSFIPILVFLCVAIPRAAFSEPITSLYKSGGLTWISENRSDSETNLLANPVSLKDGSFPVETTFTVSDPNDEPVVKSIKLLYPGGTPAAERVSLVEVWISAEKTDKKFKQVFCDRLDEKDEQPSIVTPPSIARRVRLRFFNASGGGAAILPQIVIEGSPKVAPASSPLSQDVIDLSYIIFMNDNAAGEVWLTREPKNDGFFYTEEYYFDIEIKLPNEEQNIKKSSEGYCEMETDPLLAIDKLLCKYPKWKYEARGKRGKDSFTLKPSGSYPGSSADDDEEDENTGKKKKYVYETESDQAEIYDSAMIYDKIALEGLAVGVEREYKMVLAGPGRFVDAKAQVLDYLPARGNREGAFVIWITDEEYKYFNQVAMIKADGTILRQYDYTDQTEIALTDNPDEWDIKPYVLDIEKRIEELKSSVYNFVFMPDSVAGARVHVRWNEIPPEMLKLESARQKIVSVEETEPGIYEAELETSRRYPDEPCAVESELLSDAELAPYLLADEAIETDNKRLIELSNQIVGKETDTLEKAIKIFNWLIRNIEPENTPMFDAPAASKILRSKKGDCKHFAVMFATLARIAGIPTRFAFGQRYIAGEYGYHVWDQIYIDGAWLDVDASDLGFFPGALHIQYDASSAFNEKRYIGVLLGLRPEPELSGVKTAPLDFQVIDGSRDTILNSSFYQDAYFRFKIFFPAGLNHKVMDLGFARKIMFSVSKQPKTMANVYILHTSADEKNALSMFSAFSMEGIQLMDLFGAMKKAKSQKYGETVIAGKTADFVTGEFMDKNNDYIHFELAIIKRKDSVIIFHFASPSESFRKYADSFDSIKKTFEVF